MREPAASLGRDGCSMNFRNVRNSPVRRHVLHHVRLLPERPVADRADERLLARVNLQVLLEVEPLRVDEQAAHRATLVLGPVVVHVQVEVVQVAEEHVTLDAVQRPDVLLDLALVRRHCGVVFAGNWLLWRHRLGLRLLG